jgi:hypothetical protein
MLWVMTAGVTGRVEAVPLLQLDIVGGTYDQQTQTIVSNGPIFQLIAILTPKAGESFDPTAWYFVSAAVMPQTAPPGGSYGSFTWDDDAGPVRTVNATSQMEYGVPPIESVAIGTETVDPGDLPTHSVYPTYFTEFAFKFDASHRTNTYDTAEAAGALPSTTGQSYYHTFDLNLTALQSPIAGLHFDLYDTFFKTECAGPKKSQTCSADEDIDHFAPFSHDAQSGSSLTPPPPPPSPIPEPASLVLLASGLAISARSIRKRPASTE